VAVEVEEHKPDESVDAAETGKPESTA
jgi:hypothetical protein